MRRMPVLFGAAMLISAPGFAENTIATKDYVADADVVLEEAVNAVKATPVDLKNLADGAVEIVGDEIQGTIKETKAAFKGGETVRERVNAAGILNVDNAWPNADTIVFRSYKVGDEIGKLLIAGTDSKDTTVDVSAFFKGIEFEGKASAYYNPKVNRLMVRQTAGNLLEIENVLADYRESEREIMGQQVQIESKFVEVSQTTLDELGFQWEITEGKLDLLGGVDMPAQEIFGGGLRDLVGAVTGTSAGSVSFAGSNGFDWNVAINAMERAEDSDVLSSPSVVTRDGATAVIKVGEERMVPKSFEANNQDSAAFVEHADWDLELIGVSMEVTPELRDGGLIDLALHPVVKDLIGYDSYELVPDFGAASSSSRATAEAYAGLEASLPYFRLRELETTVTVADGSTVGMGGLTYDKVVTFNDKIPLLGSIPFVGRLFRSEGENNEKRNLMIFVTATQVGVNGQTAAELALKK